MAKLLGLLLGLLIVNVVINPVSANKVVVADNVLATDSVSIETGNIYEQRIVAKTHEIGLVDLYISSIDRSVCSALRFGLGKESEVLVDKVVDMSTAHGGDFYSIGFEPITTSPGDEYWLGVMRADKNTEKCIELGMNTGQYQQGEFVVNNKVFGDSDLVFRIAYDQPVSEYIQNNLKNELYQKHEQQKVFLVLYGVLIVGLSGLVVYVWKRNE